MEDNHKIISLFPIPILHTKLSSTLANIVPWLDSQPMISNKSANNKFGERSQNSYILDSKEGKELRDVILNYALTYGKILKLKCNEYIFSQSWISHKHPNQEHYIHTHSNSLFSGVFYYGNSYNSPSSSLVFHSDSMPIFSELSIPYDLDVPMNEYNIETFHIHPRPGDLVLFPSSLKHSVPLNTTDKVRKSLAFNIVPKEGFGSEETLSQLKFN